MTTSTSPKSNPFALPPFEFVPDSELVFGRRTGPGRGKQHNPLQGLLEHGPYSSFPTGSTIRVATIALERQQAQLFSFLRRLHERASASDRLAYVPNFPGFETIFDTRLSGIQGQSFNIALANDLGDDGQHQTVVDGLVRAIQRLRAYREKWDVVAVLLPEDWEALRRSPNDEYDLHDRIKAFAAPLGVPIQFLREQSALATTQWCSTAWRLSLALFAKAGGVPWRMTPTSPLETAYIGIHYAIRGGTRNQFVTCCSQIFDSAGGGLEFVAHNLPPGDRGPRHNPHLTRDEMRVLMTRSAELYRVRHAGAMPLRLVVHKAHDWRDDEIEGVFDAWSAASDIECVTLQRSRWRSAEFRSAGSGSGDASRRSVRRGTMQQFDGYSGIFWTRGPSYSGVDGRMFTPDGKSNPRPLGFTRHSGSGDFRLLAADLLALSKMDWNNDSPYDPLPVTLGYAQKLAVVVSNAPSLEDNVYQHRLFL